MISGALLLGREEPLKKHGERLLRFLIALVVWSVVYYIWNRAFMKTEYDLKEILYVPTEPHLWYLYAMIPIYMVLPFFQVMCKGMSGKLERALLVVCSASVVFNYVVSLQNGEAYYDLPLIGDKVYMLYIFIGYFIYKYRRSNKVAVCLGFQDFSQLVRDYGDKEAKVVMNTVGNIFSGQVVGETAKTLSERFGKVLQKRQSISINRQDVSTSINTQMDALIPPSKISGLTQGMFVGSVSDNFNERIEQKIFHCEIVVDADKVKREESAYKKIPVITDFTDADGNDRMKETVQANYRRIKEEVKQIVQEELERIAGDDNLKHLLQQK